MPSELNARSLRILLVEDNPDDAALLERHLRRNGYEPSLVRVETSTEMRAELAKDDKPEFILGDYNLPSFSGPAALHLLKASGLDIPFIMMSGAVSEQTAVDSMRAGAQDYVSKQNLTRLVPAVERELKEASGRRSKLAAEVALRASEERFRHLVDAMPLGLLLNDKSGRILYANQAIGRLLNRSPEELASGAETVDSVCGDIFSVQSACTEGVSTAAPFEALCHTRDGSAINVLIGAALLNPEADKSERQFAAFVADLSLQKKSEHALRQTEKLAVAGRLAASIAHEINNPLEAIVNCLYLISNTELPEDARSYLTLAQQELDRVSQITMQTLRFYRGSTRHEATAPQELVETVLALLEARLQRGQVEVVRHFRAKATVHAQAGEIRQVIANLIGNAIDSMLSGGRLILRTREGANWASGTRGVSLTVADTGHGMEAATRSHIFEPFFSTKGITGTGLGLWISQEIVARHGGILQVRSKPKQGTVFRLFLPLTATANLLQMHSSLPVADSSNSTGSISSRA